jgi:DNA-binding NtrC family response regulator
MVSEVAKRCLEIQGPFDVETTSSIAEASERVKMKAFDVVVSDCTTFGEQAVKFLKKLHSRRRDLKVILFSELSAKELDRRIDDHVVSAHVCKTGDPAVVYVELAQSIRNAVSKNCSKSKRQ